MFSFNRFRFHYEHVIRQDLLLKLNYDNIFLVPRIEKVVLVSKVPREYKQVPLALEMICGQKAQQIESLGQPTSRVNKKLTFRAKQPSYLLVRTCLRADVMYTFCEKLVTILCFYDSNVQIQSNMIQLTIGSNLLRLFPEVQNHFELFSSANSVQVIIVTSAKTEQETRLVWTGLNQKEL